jgi:hypothetical protein
MLKMSCPYLIISLFKRNETNVMYIILWIVKGEVYITCILYGMSYYPIPKFVETVLSLISKMKYNHSVTHTLQASYRNVSS